MAPIPALKEWAAICHALLEGEQVIDLRKGGLREDGRHFGVDTTHAWLYPTAEHQKPELLKPAYQRWIDLAHRAPVGEDIVVQGYVEIVEAITISEPEQLEAVTSKVIWSPEYAAARMQWKRRDPLWVLIMRAHRLIEPITIPWDDAYKGCTSWVDLAGAPTDLNVIASTPATSDAVFQARSQSVRDAIMNATRNG